MSENSKIEWTEATWNPVTGCTKISMGCENCYAERMAIRLQAKGSPNYINGFNVTLHQHIIDLPKKWKKPRVIFVNSMSDLFHEKVPIDYMQNIFRTMNECQNHIFQILTKRAERLEELSPLLSWTNNIWMGVTIEHKDYLHRMDLLRETGAKVKFISFEPLLSSMPELDLKKIDWVIVGGESGPKARPMDQEWAIDIRNQCISKQTPFFFKQWGGVNKKKSGRLLEGKEWNETPNHKPVSPIESQLALGII